MTFTESIKSCVRTNFRGRASRSEYWHWSLFCLIGNVVTAFLDVIFGGTYSATGPVSMIFSLLILGPSIAVSVRRLHDIGRSGWWVMLAVTVLGLGILLYWAIKKGDVNENQYGPSEHEQSDIQ